MDFPTFATRTSEIESLSSDGAIQTATADLFRDILDNTDEDTAPETLAVAVRFIQGNVFPGWEQAKLDIGPQFLYTAIARSTDNTTANDVEEKVALHGDIGEVAATYDFGSQQNLLAFADTANETLTLTEVYRDLERLADASGTGSQKQKRDILFGLLNRCSPDEARYLTQLALSETHIGVTETMARQALADVFDVSTDSIDLAMQVANDYHEVIETAQDGGDGALQAVTVELGRPIQPMLAEPSTIRDSVKDWQQAAVEVKYDGARAQVHYDGDDTVKIYSRNLADVTNALPDIVQYVKENVDNPVILDGEIVAMDKNGNVLPFQNVLKRFKQEVSTQALRRQIPVTFYPFDCLYHDGEELLDEPLRDRYNELWKAYPHNHVSKQRTYSSTEGLADFESDVLADGHEGIMVKNPKSTYQPGKRGYDWRKIKPDVETLEVAITGAEWEQGIQNRKRMVSFLVGVRTEDGFKTVANIDNGIPDDQLDRLTETLKPYIRSETGKAIDIQPAVALEIGYEGIQKSSKYTSQYALRFPRFIGVREDKDVDDVDSLERVKELEKMHSLADEEDRTGSESEGGDSGRVKAPPDEESDSVEIVEMGDDDVNVVEKGDSEAANQDNDDDDDDDGSERIYTG